MKKRILGIIFVLIFAICSIGLVACGKNNNGPQAPDGNYDPSGNDPEQWDPLG